MNSFPAIIVVAFDRPKSLMRLLESIKNAYYPKNETIELIISIDFSDNNHEVQEIAKSFEWNFGQKTVLHHTTNLGLKKHILKCGDLTEKFSNVIVLEDDLYVSPNYYLYTIEALEFSSDKEYISGISLYNHKTNVHVGEYFAALEDGYDNWYFQFASSWGQAWSKKQWIGFKEWLKTNPILKKSDTIPENVTNWSDKSWLKLFIAYLIRTDKFFLYPKISLTTNFSDKGTHATSDSTHFQVELLIEKKERYHFSGIEESKSVYDAFFENKKLGHFILKGDYNIQIDLYGYKPVLKKSNFLLTSRNLNYKIEKSYARSMKPLEVNILNNISGEELFLYNLSKSQKNKFEKKSRLQYRRIVYSTKYVSYATSLLLFKKLLKSRFHNALKKLKHKSPLNG